MDDSVPRQAGAMIGFAAGWMDNAYTHAFGVLGTLLAEESGQDLIEYGLIVAFLALGTVAAMKGIASSLGSFFASLGNVLTGSV